MTPATLSMGLVGVSYGPLALGSCGGTPPYTWSAAAGSLPPGLSLSAAGVLSGTPSAVWTTTFDVTLADNTNQRVSKTFTLRVVQPLVFPYTNLPDAKVLATYSAALSASGGVPPYAWSVVNPPLPLVLGLDSSSGVISGGAPQLPGTYTFQIRVTDSVGQSVTNSVQLTVAPSPGYVCSANSGVPPMIRSEGRAELASDIWLLCTYDALSNGPTPLGVPIPTTDIQLTFTAPTSWVDPGAVSPGSIPV